MITRSSRTFNSILNLSSWSLARGACKCAGHFGGCLLSGAAQYFRFSNHLRDKSGWSHGQMGTVWRMHVQKKHSSRPWASRVFAQVIIQRICDLFVKFFKEVGGKVNDGLGAVLHCSPGVVYS